MKSYITNVYEKLVMAMFVWAGLKVMLIELHRIQQKAMNKSGYVANGIFSDALCEEKSIKRFFTTTPKELMTPSALYVLWGHVLDIKSMYSKYVDNK